MLNARVEIRVDELGRPLPTLQARFASSFVLKLLNVPHDIQGLFVRVFKANDPDGYFDLPANQDGNGDWECYIIGTTFVATGIAVYEVHAQDADGNQTALGAGKVSIRPFSVGSSPTPQGSVISVATLPDETGALHQVQAVNIGTAEHPEWSWQVKTINGR